MLIRVDYSIAKEGRIVISIETVLQDLVDTLNEALEADKDAMMELCGKTVKTPTEGDLATHPSIQVELDQEDSDICNLRLIGLLNGFALRYNGVITEDIDPEDGIVSFTLRDMDEFIEKGGSLDEQ